jgi:GntR family transcriptional regulator
VRKALDELQDLGLISRRKNVGRRVEAQRPKPGFSQSIATVDELAQFAPSTCA